ncbi:uncharacterized protein LOC121386486 [Gigantopelta aegis]|uniref:uncharacterized protein LOC121386486 n=1 Tax=Gigantopelta aegis TaxID=1735272 RepID=UPI001B88E27C|nr:uncharacterized protein LOC121386486 [Gigantopelta aegis]
MYCAFVFAEVVIEQEDSCLCLEVEHDLDVTGNEVQPIHVEDDEADVQKTVPKKKFKNSNMKTGSKELLLLDMDVCNLEKEKLIAETLKIKAETQKVNEELKLILLKQQ